MKSAFRKITFVYILLVVCLSFALFVSARAGELCPDSPTGRCETPSVILCGSPTGRCETPTASTSAGEEDVSGCTMFTCNDWEALKDSEGSAGRGGKPEPTPTANETMTKTLEGLRIPIQRVLKPIRFQ